MRWQGYKAKMALERGGKEGLNEALEYMLDEMNKIVPHDEGTLMRSGTIKQKGLKGAIGYNTPYAIRLHEHPEYNFRGGREGKWVAKIIKDKRIQKRALEHIAKRIRQKMR